MKLYYYPGACSLGVRIIINELACPCEFEKVDLKTKQTETGRDFLTINPKGAVPTLELAENSILTENAVILQFLADSNKAYQLLPPLENFSRYQTLEWLNYITTELHKGFSTLFNPTIDQALKKQIFIPLIQKKLEFVNQQLANKDYLLAQGFSLADAYLFVILLWAKQFYLMSDEWSHLQQYFKQLQERKSIKEALAAEQLSV